MPCERIGNAIVCSNTIIEHKGFIIEFPKIGCPAMLNKDYEIIDKPPKEFWDAVEDYQYKQKVETRLTALERVLKGIKDGL